MLIFLQVIWYWESFLKHKQAREIGWLPSNSLSPQFYRLLFPFQPIQPQISISSEQERVGEREREREREIERKRWVEKRRRKGGIGEMGWGEGGRAEMKAKEVRCVAEWQKVSR